MYFEKDLIGLILARGGSKRLPRKNILILGDHPLIAYPIMESKKILNKVYVSTDDEEISDISKSYGAEVIIRPKELASDFSTDLDSFKHFIDETLFSGDILQLRATTPLVKFDILENIIDFFQKNKNICTSLRTGHETSESVYKFFIKKDIFWSGIIDNKNNIEFYNNPSQLLPKTYCPNGYADIIKTSIIKNNLLHGARILSYETEFAPEVDTPLDFEFLKFYFNKYYV